jgi:hypothetical protein
MPREAFNAPKTFKLISIGQLGTIQPANEMKCQIEADVDAGFEMLTST